MGKKFMMLDTWLTAAGDVFGVIAIVAAVWAVFDARRERSKREKAMLAARSVIERSYGLLIGIKPSVMPLGEEHEVAINNGLQAIDQARAELAHL
jgi:hypothetical protein